MASGFIVILGTGGVPVGTEFPNFGVTLGVTIGTAPTFGVTLGVGVAATAAAA